MKLLDALDIIATRVLTAAVDRGTAAEQVRVLCEQFSRDPADIVLDIAIEAARAKSALAASKTRVEART